jgi:hypothetical protein
VHSGFPKKRVYLDDRALAEEPERYVIARLRE